MVVAQGPGVVAIHLGELVGLQLILLLIDQDHGLVQDLAPKHDH